MDKAQRIDLGHAIYLLDVLLNEYASNGEELSSAYRETERCKVLLVRIVERVEAARWT